MSRRRGEEYAGQVEAHVVGHEMLLISENNALRWKINSLRTCDIARLRPYKQRRPVSDIGSLGMSSSLAGGAAWQKPGLDHSPARQCFRMHCGVAQRGAAAAIPLRL